MESFNNVGSGILCFRLKRALLLGTPEIFNCDQGSQFTSKIFIKVLKETGVRISMDGRGRCFDNIFVERLWRTLKYEEVYIHDYTSVSNVQDNIAKYFDFYNTERLHQALDYKTPTEVYLIGKQVTHNFCLVSDEPGRCPILDETKIMDNLPGNAKKSSCSFHLNFMKKWS